MKKVLEVGDRVEAIGDVAEVDLKGKRGVVRKVDNDPQIPVLVEFDEAFPEGHGGLGDGECKDGHGRWGWHEEFKIITAEKGAKKRLTGGKGYDVERVV